MTPSINNLRRRAAKLGWAFFKSNWRKNSIDNLGEYRLVEGSSKAGTMIDGDRFNLSLEDVARHIEREERRMAG